jgi:hypothetical protein
MAAASRYRPGGGGKVRAECAAAGSLVPIVGGLGLAYVDRHLVPANMTNWDASDVFGDVVNIAIPVMGFVLGSRRPQNRIGWLALAAGLTLGLSSFTNQYDQRALVAAPGPCRPGRRPYGRPRGSGLSPSPWSLSCSCSSRPGGCARGGGARPRG